MKKILIALRDLKIGGIEKSAITLINYLIEKQYQVTLVLEGKKGELLKDVDSRVKIIEYIPSTYKMKFFRKCINFCKRLKFIFKYRNKFDCSISYATYSKVCSFVARKSSKKSILWCHADYLELFNDNKDEVKDFFEEIFFEQFNKIVFVSKRAIENFKKVFPKQENLYFCNNLINSKEIYRKAEEPIDLEHNPKIPTFLNVGRHDEKQKKLTRIIKAAALLRKQNYKFKIIFVGDGKDSQKYKKMVEKYRLENYIIFTGEKENPYPYFKIANCVVLSSDYEGYPVVFLESYVLNKPIITTDVSDFEDIKNGRGLVVKKNAQDIYRAMKFFLDFGYGIEVNFNASKYNNEMEKNLENIFKTT